MNQSRDLFDDTSMTFGEHLECLRVHLIRALLGLVLCVGVSLFFGDSIVAVVRWPIDRALRNSSARVVDNLKDSEFEWSWEGVQNALGLSDPGVSDDPTGSRPTLEPLETGRDPDRTISISLMPSELAAALHESDPEKYPEVKPVTDEKPFRLRLAAPEFQQLETVIERQSQAVTLNVQEAFMTYLKVGLISGILLGSPWLFYQAWQFVAAGLYPHERKYVYTYLPMSLGLFLGGAAFCFIAVFPFVLKFLLGFNEMLHVQPQIRLSEWISFAVTLPLMFGISFQLPLVMLFLERISVFEVKDYREKRRLSILVIAFLSMILTPADPISMMLMMFPLLFLYEMGIVLCGYHPRRPGFDDGEPAPA